VTIAELLGNRCLERAQRIPGKGYVDFVHGCSHQRAVLDPCGIRSELDESDDENIRCSCQVYFTLTDGGEEGWGEQTKKKKVELEFFKRGLSELTPAIKSAWGVPVGVAEGNGRERDNRDSPKSRSKIANFLSLSM
jgi:hypothetical protein